MNKITFYLFVLVLTISCKKDMGKPDLLADLPTNTWNWIDVDSMFCRDGSQTGIGIRLTNSENLIIFLEGGGACFDASTCESNPSKFAQNDFENFISQERLNSGIFNNSKNENPFKDWNVIYVPYCTGDVHSGNTNSGTPLGVSDLQRFNGYKNFEAVMTAISNHFNNKNVKKVALTGVSAGGFGTLINFDQLANTFKSSELYLINDSGPLTNDLNVLPFCLQFGLQFIFRIPIAAEIIDCCENPSGYSVIHTYLARKYPQHHFALISYLTDPTIRFFFRFGQGECTNANDISEEAIKTSFIKLRDDLLIPEPNWSSFFADENWHTFLTFDNRFYETKVKDVYLYEFFESVLSKESNHISPE